ncbi:MAG: MFS transporter [Chloroflexota bacterium]|nr:MFS transporter [Chloroflexota bacterium]
MSLTRIAERLITGTPKPDIACLEPHVVPIVNDSARRAATLFYLISGLTSFAFALIFTVNLICQAQIVGLNPLQLVLVGTTLEITVFLFEIPTGIVADVYSRRLSVMIGFFLIGVGYLIEGLVPTFGAVLLNQVVWGIGATFTSGALEAWIADEVGDEALGAVLLRGSQIGSIAGIVGTICAGVLGSIALTAPIVVGAILFLILTVILMASMPENGFTPAADRGARVTLSGERGVIGAMLRTSRAALTQIRTRPILVTFLAIALIAGAYSEGFDRLWREHLLENFAFPAIGALTPVLWFTLIGLINMALITVGAEVARRRIDTADNRAIGAALIVMYGGRVLALAIFAVSGNFALAIVAYLVGENLRAVSAPLIDTWTNQQIDSQSRATVISTLHQFDALGQVGGGPLVGFVGLRLGLRAAMLTCALLLAPLVPLVNRARR